MERIGWFKVFKRTTERARRQKLRLRRPVDRVLSPLLGGLS